MKIYNKVVQNKCNLKLNLMRAVKLFKILSLQTFSFQTQMK
jgi:hypothetical protein